MDEYRHIIMGAIANLMETEVEIPRYGLVLKPWDSWAENQNPIWWRAYNGVKHRRHERYAEANLKNALNSVCGLFLFLFFLYRAQATAGELGPNPSMLRLGRPFRTDHPFWGETAKIIYFLDTR